MYREAPSMFRGKDKDVRINVRDIPSGSDDSKDESGNGKKEIIK